MATSLPSTARSATRQLIRHYSAPISSSIPAAKQKFVPSMAHYPKGFLVSGTHVGVKPANKSNPDLALIASDRPAFGAAVFTTNKFQAAPVQVSRSVLEKRGGAGIRSIVINSGCANAVTGQGGMDDAWAMSSTTTAQFQQSSQPDDQLGPNSLVMSTGVIGQRLPIKKILSKIPTAHTHLGDDHNAWLSYRQSNLHNRHIPQTPLHDLHAARSRHAGAEYRLAGMTKGAGMIHPNMATLLGILCTDAPISATRSHPY